MHVRWSLIPTPVAAFVFLSLSMVCDVVFCITRN